MQSAASSSKMRWKRLLRGVASRRVVRSPRQTIAIFPDAAVFMRPPLMEFASRDAERAQSPGAGGWRPARPEQVCSPACYGEASENSQALVRRQLIRLGVVTLAVLAVRFTRGQAQANERVVAQHCLVE